MFKFQGSWRFQNNCSNLNTVLQLSTGWQCNAAGFTGDRGEWSSTPIRAHGELTILFLVFSSLIKMHHQRLKTKGGVILSACIRPVTLTDTYLEQTLSRHGKDQIHHLKNITVPYTAEEKLSKTHTILKINVRRNWKQLPANKWNQSFEDNLYKTTQYKVL